MRYVRLDRSGVMNKSPKCQHLQLDWIMVWWRTEKLQQWFQWWLCPSNKRFQAYSVTGSSHWMPYDPPVLPCAGYRLWMQSGVRVQIGASVTNLCFLIHPNRIWCGDVLSSRHGVPVGWWCVHHKQYAVLISAQIYRWRLLPSLICLFLTTLSMIMRCYTIWLQHLILVMSAFHSILVSWLLNKPTFQTAFCSY